MSDEYCEECNGTGVLKKYFKNEDILDGVSYLKPLNCHKCGGTGKNITIGIDLGEPGGDVTKKMIYYEHEGCTCQSCGVIFYKDLIVPDDIWEEIKPRGKPIGSGLLCPSCQIYRVIKLDKVKCLRLTVDI